MVSGSVIWAMSLMGAEQAGQPIAGTMRDYVNASIQALGGISWHNCWAGHSRNTYKEWPFYKTANILF